MSSYGFVRNHIYKWWYGSELYSAPWRKVQWDKREIEESVKILTPSNPDIRHLQILLHGPVGAGKSSFINSLRSVFQQRISVKEKVTPSSSTSCTKMMEECSDKLQVPMTCIFPVKNYNEELETNNDVDVLLLLALKQIAHFANDYAEDL